jgi:hypothetical protein
VGPSGPNSRCSPSTPSAAGGRARWLSFKDEQNRTYYWSAETNTSVWTLPEPKQTLDPYNNPLVTPLHEWIELPVAQELVHDTAALQVRRGGGGLRNVQS